MHGFKMKGWRGKSEVILSPGWLRASEEQQELDKDGSQREVSSA